MRIEPEFFVGYLPMPAGLKKVIRRVLGAIGIVVAAVALFLVAGQRPFPASTFEFQQYRDFEGVVRTSPYPALSIPGQEPPWLLVLPGKHGAQDAIQGLDNRQVALKGSRIFREHDHMIELVPGSIQAGAAAAPASAIDLGEVRLTGEIVDSKCYFGVMNPGNGKAHRDCAVRCINGGIPPAFLVRDAAGHATTLLLAKIKPELLDHIAEPVTLHGRLTRSEGRLILHPE
jgi:hypothetical protein